MDQTLTILKKNKDTKLTDVSLFYSLFFISFREIGDIRLGSIPLRDPNVKHKHTFHEAYCHVI